MKNLFQNFNDHSAEREYLKTNKRFFKLNLYLSYLIKILFCMCWFLHVFINHDATWKLYLFLFFSEVAIILCCSLHFYYAKFFVLWNKLSTIIITLLFLFLMFENGNIAQYALFFAGFHFCSIFSNFIMFCYWYVSGFLYSATLIFFTIKFYDSSLIFILIYNLLLIFFQVIEFYSKEKFMRAIWKKKQCRKVLEKEHESILKQTEEDKKKEGVNYYSYLIEDVIPGFIFLLRKKERASETEQTSSFETYYELTLTNKKSRQILNIKDFNDLENFLQNIRIIDEKARASHMLLESIITKFMDSLKNESSLEILGYDTTQNVSVLLSLIPFNINKNHHFFVKIEKFQLIDEIKILKEKDTKKDKLLASISHDLRSPLNGIINFVSTAKDCDNINERNKYLDYARINGNLLMSMINDLLDYSAINNNKMSLTINEFSLNEIISETLSLMEIQASCKKIKLELINELQSINPILKSDSRRLKQILINLIGNAIKFTQKGTIKLKVKRVEIPNIIKFEVIDSGVGIKEEIREQLCKEYATFDTEKGLNQYGNGLGLSICHNLVKLLGPFDNLFISSVYGKGSKFGFLLFENFLDKKNLNQCSIRAISPRRNINSVIKVGRYINKSHSAIPTNTFIELQKRKKGLKTKINRMESKTLPPIIFEEVMQRLESNSLLKSTISKLASKEDVKYFNYRMDFKRNVLKTQTVALKQCTYLPQYPLRSSSKLFEEKSFFTDTKDAFSEFEPGQSLGTSLNSDSGEEFRENYKNMVFENRNGMLRSSIKRMSSNSETRINMPLIFINHTFSECSNEKSPKSKKSFEMNEIIQKKELKVMVVDDDAFNIFVMKGFLGKITEWEINIEIASNGEDCIELFKKRNGINKHSPFDCIFIDCMMPIMDGYTASKKMKELIKTNLYYDSAIIAVTGMTGSNEESKCFEAGMDEVISKPVSEKDVRDVINYVLEKLL